MLDADVPETLEDATLARIGRLSPEAQAVARAGAVVGRSFISSVLAGVMNLPVDSLDDPIQGAPLEPRAARAPFRADSPPV